MEKILMYLLKYISFTYFSQYVGANKLVVSDNFQNKYVVFGIQIILKGIMRNNGSFKCFFILKDLRNQGL